MDISTTAQIFALVASLGGETQTLDTFRSNLDCEIARSNMSQSTVQYTCKTEEIITQYECGRDIVMWQDNSLRFWKEKYVTIGEGCQMFNEFTPGKRHYFGSNTYRHSLPMLGWKNVEIKVDI